MIAFGMACLQFENIVHGDRKPAKILLDKNCSLRSCPFGFSKVISLGNAMKMTIAWTIPHHWDTNLMTRSRDKKGDFFGAMDSDCYKMIRCAVLPQQCTFQMN
jgi:serine/threonine protein kinase